MPTKQKIEDRPVNYVSLCIRTENGCDAGDGEYSIYITGFIGSLELTCPGGHDDIELIRDCIEEIFGELDLPDDGYTEVILRESGEWEDVFWHKYYVIERVNQVE